MLNKEVHRYTKNGSRFLLDIRCFSRNIADLPKVGKLNNISPHNSMPALVRRKMLLYFMVFRDNVGRPLLAVGKKLVALSSCTRSRPGRCFIPTLKRSHCLLKFCFKVYFAIIPNKAQITKVYTLLCRSVWTQLGF